MPSQQQYLAPSTRFHRHPQQFVSPPHTYMYSYVYPSPTRSTPGLYYEPLQEPDSPPDDYLATPDISAWKEVRRLEDDKVNNEQLAAIETSYRYALPSLDTLSRNQRPLLSELPAPLPPWPHSTIAPKDAFYDYQEVQQFLQEQARPASPSAFSDDYSSSSSPYSSYNVDDLYFYDDPSSSRADARDTPSTSTMSSARPSTSPVPSRRVGKKAKREETDDEYAPASKRRNTGKRARSFHDDHDDDDQEDNGTEYEDESGDFRPVRRATQKQSRQPRACSSRSTSSAACPCPSTAPPKKKKKTKCNRGEDYVVGPCDCQMEGCISCQMTCFYCFCYGNRKGEICKRIFESGRHLDLRRHKVTHAVQEWKWLLDGKITDAEAYWYHVVFEGNEHGFMCPLDGCQTTFTRYDALTRHLTNVCPTLRKGKKPLEPLPKGQMAGIPNLPEIELKEWLANASEDKITRTAAAKQKRV